MISTSCAPGNGSGSPAADRTGGHRDDPSTITALRTHRAGQNAEKLAWGAAYQDTGHLFAHEDGTPLHPNVMTRTFVRMAERAGMPRIRLHDVRHSAITAMLLRGEAVLTVSRRAGHASTSFTQDVYGHVMEQADRDAAARLAEAIDG